MSNLPAHRTTDGTPVWISGDGPTLVLVHGVLMDHRMWALQVLGLKPHFRIVTYDMLGHGASPNPPGERSLGDFVTQLEQVADEFGGEAPLVLLGFSMGALVAQAYAIRHSVRLRALILMNSVYDRSTEERAAVGLRLHNLAENGIESVVEAAMERWHTEEEQRTHRAIIEEMMNIMRDGDITSKTKAYRVFATADAETAGRVKNIECPTLVMTGSGDLGSPPHMSEKLATEIPHAQVMIVAGQRHQMPVIVPEAVNRAILDFVETST